MINVKNLHVYYGMIEAVKGINFSVETGQIVSLIGSNGAGKTSTLNALINSVRRTGEISFSGFEENNRNTEVLGRQQDYFLQSLSSPGEGNSHLDGLGFSIGLAEKFVRVFRDIL